MVEFRRLVRNKRSVDIKDLLKLFESLDRQTSHTEPRPAQRQALREMTKRRGERDLVLKISTGAGKTGVGLLFLLSHMEEMEEPVVYLCPTVQLVEQVLAEAARLGISAVPYSGGERYPDAEATAAKAIIVCTYDKLFNAKTTFDRPDINLRPHAFVFDDAHAGVEEIRNAFTLSITDGKLRESLLGLLEPGCSKYKPGIWGDITNDDPQASLEVPYWIWRPVVAEAQKKILSRYSSDHSEDTGFIFVWPFLRDILSWCRCIVAGTGIELVPDVIPVQKSRAFYEAKHRLFMSATLADDSILVRELGCDVESAARPIMPKSDRGLGERMVVAPSLIDAGLNRNWVMQQCERLSKKWRVVVLCSSDRAARDWVPFGAKVFLGEEVNKAVRKLKDDTSDVRFAVFSQRYDGVDLPDNACRILVIDGMPHGEGLTDRYDSSLTATQGGVRNRLTYRLEQGMGRAVRSHVDYAVVILSGADLANFIARKEVLRNMNPDTRAQLSLARDLAKLANDDGQEDSGKVVIEMIGQCLNRDEGWKQYYDENVRNIAKSGQEMTTAAEARDLADAERKAFELALNNRVIDAVRTLRTALTKQKLTKMQEGWYLQKIASYQHEIEPGEALKTQASAHDRNDLVFCPPTATSKVSGVTKFSTQAVVLEWFHEFDHPNGAIVAIQDLRGRLSYSVSAETMEQALLELAPLLGAKGSRPEQQYNEGPDDLWLWPDVSLVVEAKNQNEDALHKKDAGQLLLSLQWFKRNFPKQQTPVPIVIARVNVADRKAGFPDGTRVVTPEKMRALLDEIEGFFQNLTNELPLMTQAHLILERQTARGLTPEQFVGRFTVPLQEKR